MLIQWYHSSTGMAASGSLLLSLNLGLSVQLGHNGAACPSPVTFEAPLTVYHTNGAHFVKVSYCQCGGPAGGYLYPNQLLRATWFPASLTRPRTVFTFAFLSTSIISLLQGQNNGI
jgi:hypothetical protein